MLSFLNHTSYYNNIDDHSDLLRIEEDFEFWKPRVVAYIQKYYSDTTKIALWKKELENGIELVFDSGVANYRETMANGYSEFRSPTERVALLPRMRLEAKIEQATEFCRYFERILNLVSEEDRSTLEARYITKKPYYLTFEEWLPGLNLPYRSRSHFYRGAKDALKNLIVKGEPFLHVLLEHDRHVEKSLGKIREKIGKNNSNNFVNL